MRFFNKAIHHIKNQPEESELSQFSSAILSVIESTKLQDSLIEQLSKNHSVKEFMITKIGTYEHKILTLESLLIEKGNEVLSISSKLKGAIETNAKQQLEITELHKLMPKIEDKHKQAFSENQKFLDTLKKQINELQNETNKLKNELIEKEKQSMIFQKENRDIHKNLDDKIAEVELIKKNYVPVEKYRKVLEDREKALEKLYLLENNLLTQTTHNEKLKDKLNNVKQEFQSTLSDNEERHKKEVHEINNTMTRKFGTADRHDSDALTNHKNLNVTRAKSSTQADLEGNKKSLPKTSELESLKISWENIEILNSLAAEENRKEKKDISLHKYEELQKQFEIFKNENQKELSASNLKIRSLLEDINKLKLENQKINVERNTLKKSINDAQSRDNSFIRKSSNPLGTGEFGEKVSKLERLTNQLKKENKFLKSKLDDDGIAHYQHLDLLYTAILKNSIVK